MKSCRKGWGGVSTRRAEMCEGKMVKKREEEKTGIVRK